MPLHLALGIIAGLLAAGYNWALIAALAGADYLRRCPVELRAGLIGAAVGALAWFAPDLVGGGDPLTQRALDGSGTLGVISLVFLLRFPRRGVLCRRHAGRSVCSAPRTRRATRTVLGILARMAFPDLDIVPQGFAVVGMAAFFAGVARRSPASPWWSR